MSIKILHKSVQDYLSQPSVKTVKELCSFIQMEPQNFFCQDRKVVELILEHYWIPSNSPIPNFEELQIHPEKKITVGIVSSLKKLNDLNFNLEIYNEGNILHCENPQIDPNRLKDRDTVWYFPLIGLGAWDDYLVNMWEKQYGNRFHYRKVKENFKIIRGDFFDDGNCLQKREVEITERIELEESVQQSVRHVLFFYDRLKKMRISWKTSWMLASGLFFIVKTTILMSKLNIIDTRVSKTFQLFLQGYLYLGSPPIKAGDEINDNVELIRYFFDLSSLLSLPA